MSDLTNSAAQAAGDMGTQVQQQTADLAADAQEAARRQAHAGKQQAAENLTQVSDAFRMAGRHLNQQDSPAGQYVEELGRRLEMAAGYLHNRSVDELLEDATGFARRRPALVMGGAFVLGFAATRFLKTSTNARGGGSAGGRYPAQGTAGRFPGDAYPARTPEFNRGPIEEEAAPLTQGVTAAGRAVDPAVGATPPPYGVPYERSDG